MCKKCGSRQIPQTAFPGIEEPYYTVVLTVDTQYTSVVTNGRRLVIKGNSVTIYNRDLIALVLTGAIQKEQIIFTSDASRLVFEGELWAAQLNS